MADYINGQRQSYTSHEPFDGYPWKGEYKSPMTWSVKLGWDDGLAQEAQAEADRLGGGGSPDGGEYAYQNSHLFSSFPQESVWLKGLETAKYQISAKSDPEVNDQNCPSGGPMKWHLATNGTMRQGLFYQTGSGSHNKKTKIGVGMADAGGGAVWWVILISE